MVISSGLMLLILVGIRLILPYPHESAILMRILWITGAMIIAASVYTASTVFLHCSEWQWIRGALKNKKKSDTADSKE